MWMTRQQHDTQRGVGGFNTLYSVHRNEGMYNTCTPCIGQYISTVQALGHLVGLAAAHCERAAAGATLHDEPEGSDGNSSSSRLLILVASQPSKQDPRHPQQKRQWRKKEQGTNVLHPPATHTITCRKRTIKDKTLLDSLSSCG